MLIAIQSRTLAVMLALACLAMLGNPGTAQAQVRDVDPYYVTVAADNTPLRSGDLRSYYPVATLAPGVVLRVTGAGERWLRVEYPAGLSALARADRATLDETRRTVTLSADGRLKALSDTKYGIDGSFRDVQGPVLPAGTTLQYLRTETSSRGTVFYVVRAPRASAGFLEPGQVRRATQDEIERHEASLPRDQRTTTLRTPSPTERSTQPQATPPQATPQDASPQVTPARETSQPALTRQPESDPAGVSLLEDMNPAPAQSDPVQAQGTPASPPSTEPVQRAARQAPPQAGNGRATARPGAALDDLASIDDLMVAFESVRRQGNREAEIEELIAQFERTLASLSDDAENQAVRRWIEQRVQLLEIRRNVQRRLGSLERAQAALQDGIGDRELAAQRLRQLAIYEYVGVLQRSAVYDGDRLPLMYRLVTVGEPLPRTLGYLEPSDEFNLDRMVGQVIGVNGPARQASDLQLNAIRATLVESLAPDGETTVRYATESDN
ncbi:MAG: hypothetical protein AAFX79_05925 [Planctomycetota bacterium]